MAEASLKIEIEDSGPPASAGDSPHADAAREGAARPAGPIPDRVGLDIADALKRFGADFLSKAMDNAGKAEKAGPLTKPNKAGGVPGQLPEPAGVEFPTTVIGPDGKVYSRAAYEAAQARLKRDQINADNTAAYEAFKPKEAPKKVGPQPPPLPGKLEPPGKGPPELPGEKKAWLTKATAEGTGQALLGGMAGGVIESAGLIAGGALAMGPLAAFGAVLPIATMAAQAVTTGLQNMKRNVDAVGDSLATFAGNERAGVGQLMDGAQAALQAPGESLPIIGDMVKASDELRDAIVKLPEKLTVAFLAQAQKLAPYSGAISGANAKADVRNIMADLKEANEMGESYAQMIDAQSRLDNTVRELLMPIKKFLVEVLAARLEVMADALNVLVNLPSILEAIAKDTGMAIVDAARLHFTDALDDLKKLGKDIRDILKKKEEADPKDFFDGFFKDAANAKIAGKFAG